VTSVLRPAADALLAVADAYGDPWAACRVLEGWAPPVHTWTARMTGPHDLLRLEESLRAAAAGRQGLCVALAPDEADAAPRWFWLDAAELPVGRAASGLPPLAARAWRTGPPWEIGVGEEDGETVVRLRAAAPVLDDARAEQLWREAVDLYEVGTARAHSAPPAVSPGPSGRPPARGRYDREPARLPLDRARPRVWGAGDARVEQSVDATLAAAIDDTAARLGVTAPLVVLTALVLACARVSACPAVRVQSRLPWDGAGSGPGCAAVSRTLEAAVQDRDTFVDAVWAVGDALAEAGDAGAGASLTAGFVARSPGPATALAGSTVQWERETTGSLAVDLELDYTAGAPARLCWRYRPELFEGHSVRALAAVFQDLLVDARRRPDVAVADLARPSPPTALSGPEAATDPASRRSLPEDVEAQAERRPDAIALTCGRVSMTYRRVAERQAQVAAALTAPLAPGRPVGVLARPHLDLAPTLLGVLQAGGSVVPVDAGGARTAALTRALDLGPIVPPGAPTSPAPGRGAAPEAITWHPSRPFAYYLTSGSTGRPKIVCTPSGGVLNFRDHLTGAMGLGPDDVVLQLASLTFDASLRDLLCPLSAGAHVVVPTAEERGDLVALAELLDVHGVTCLLAVVPTMLRELLRAAPAAPASLRLVLVSGEPLPSELAEEVRRWAPTAEVVNQYGLTETTMTATYHVVGPADLQRATVPAGGPIQGVRVRVVDDDLRACPAGALGEVVISGAGVAGGYTSPALTAQRFVPDPAGPAGSRMVRTGDVGRVLPTGGLRLHGRSDQQVKVRGNRVEIAESESLVRGCAGVIDAVVGLVDGVLVAWHTGSSDGTAIRAQLDGVAPDFLIPTRYVALTELPVTSSGKVDRTALRAPGTTASTSGPSADVGPRDLAEHHVAAAYRAVLGTTAVRATDQFSDLGGDRLAAVAVAAALTSSTGRRVAPWTVLEAGSVERLGERLGPDLPRLVTLSEGEGRPVVLVPDASGLLGHYAPLVGALGGPVHALHGWVGTEGVAAEDQWGAWVADALAATAPLRALRPVWIGWGHGARISAGVAARGCGAGLVAVVPDDEAPLTGRAVDRLARQLIDDASPLPADDSAALRELLQRLRRAGVLPPGARADVVRRMRDSVEAAEAASDEPVLASGPVVVVGARGALPGWLRAEHARVVRAPAPPSASPSLAQVAALAAVLAPQVEELRR